MEGRHPKKKERERERDGRPAGEASAMILQRSFATREETFSISGLLSNGRIL
jgi:hypothetical protein